MGRFWLENIRVGRRRKLSVEVLGDRFNSIGRVGSCDGGFGFFFD